MTNGLVIALAAFHFERQFLLAANVFDDVGGDFRAGGEVDEKTVQRAARVCVDSRASALREAGDLLPALEKGRLHEGQLVELGEVIAGVRPGRGTPAEITLFESQGMAIQDLAVAKRLLALARERGCGRELPW